MSDLLHKRWVCGLVMVAAIVGCFMAADAQAILVDHFPRSLGSDVGLDRILGRAASQEEMRSPPSTLLAWQPPFPPSEWRVPPNRPQRPPGPAHDYRHRVPPGVQPPPPRGPQPPNDPGYRPPHDPGQRSPGPSPRSPGGLPVPRMGS